MDCLSMAQSDIINTEDSASQVMIRNSVPRPPFKGNSELSKTLRKPLLPQKLLDLGSQVSFARKFISFLDNLYPLSKTEDLF